jgi:hypothetical protein
LGGAPPRARLLAANTITKKQVYIQQHADTLLEQHPKPLLACSLLHRYHLQPTHWLLLRRRLDTSTRFHHPVSVWAQRSDAPVQLNTNFNAAIYLGRRP